MKLKAGDVLNDMLPSAYTEDEIEDRKERPMHDSKENEERMELPKALKPDAPEIKGYRKLSVHEVEAINNIKYMGIEIGRMCDKVEKMHDIDERWLAIGKINLQQGLMAITRSITQPETF